ncbi:TonB-dependent siderophore receptor [Hyphomicrobium methylovorum]|uniref:TonB-dependent siderophore receptor n=1 Tax=Hyphomicrobium methylovorum TaxID=84 RepID=UPI0015E66014|nr:TonB-dependent siderophore receptor [Hyphomicrobium methylovorum]
MTVRSRSGLRAKTAAVAIILACPGIASAQQPDGADASAASEAAQDVDSAAQLPQVEVVTQTKPKPAPKKRAKKQAPQAVASGSTAAPTGVATPYADGPRAPSGPGAAAIVDGYAATNSTSGTKTDTPLRETPQSISVAGKEQMRDQGVQTLDQALRYMPGVQAEPYGVDSRGDFASIRGTQAAYFLDGMKVSNGYSVSTAPIEPYGLERVEALRGPASMLYGQAPTGGIINAVSKLPLDVPYNEIGIQYGSFDFKQTRFDFTGPMTTDGKWLYRVVGLARDADTQVDYVGNDRLFLAPSITYRPTNDTTVTVLGNFRKDKGGSTEQFFPNIGTLTPNVNGQRVPINTFAGEPGDYNNTEQQSGTLLFDHRFSDALKFHQSMRYAHTANDTDSTYSAILSPARFGYLNSLFAMMSSPPFNLPIAPLDPSNAPFLNAGQSEIARARTKTSQDTTVFNSDTNFVARFSTGPFEHKVLGGFDYMRYSQTSASAGLLVDNVLTSSTQPFFPIQSVFDIYAPQYNRRTVFLSTTDPRVFVPANDIKMYDLAPKVQQQTGIYVQDQLKLGQWQAILGLRQDWLSAAQTGNPTEHEDALTGRAALMYNFKSGLSPYVSYATSFSANPGVPVADNLYASFLDTRPAQANRGEQVEVGFKYQPNGAPFLINAAIYELTDRNRIVQPDILFQAVQGADVKVRGFEIEAAGQLTREVKVIASYSYTDAKYEKYPELFPFPSGISQLMQGERTEGDPKHMASLWGIYSFQDSWLRGLSFGGGVRYTGETDSVALDVATFERLSVKTPGFTLFDAMVAYEKDDWRWDLTVQNVADKYTVTTCTASRGDCFLGQARTIITGLTYKF